MQLSTKRGVRRAVFVTGGMIVAGTGVASANETSCPETATPPLDEPNLLPAKPMPQPPAHTHRGNQHFAGDLFSKHSIEYRNKPAPQSISGQQVSGQQVSGQQEGSSRTRQGQQTGPQRPGPQHHRALSDDERITGHGRTAQSPGRSTATHPTRPSAAAPLMPGFPAPTPRSTGNGFNGTANAVGPRHERGPLATDHSSTVPNAAGPNAAGPSAAWPNMVGSNAAESTVPEMHAVVADSGQHHRRPEPAEDNRFEATRPLKPVTPSPSQGFYRSVTWSGSLGEFAIPAPRPPKIIIPEQNPAAFDGFTADEGLLDFWNAALEKGALGLSLEQGTLGGDPARDSLSRNDAAAFGTQGDGTRENTPARGALGTVLEQGALGGMDLTTTNLPEPPLNTRMIPPDLVTTAMVTHVPHKVEPKKDLMPLHVPGGHLLKAAEIPKLPQDTTLLMSATYVRDTGPADDLSDLERTDPVLMRALQMNPDSHISSALGGTTAVPAAGERSSTPADSVTTTIPGLMCLSGGGGEYFPQPRNVMPQNAHHARPLDETLPVAGHGVLRPIDVTAPIPRVETHV